MIFAPQPSRFVAPGIVAKAAKSASAGLLLGVNPVTPAAAFDYINALPFDL
jgi:hypothetical protein